MQAQKYDLPDKEGGAQKNRARHLGLDPQPPELEEIHHCC